MKRLLTPIQKIRVFFRKYWVAIAIGASIGVMAGIGVLLVNVAGLARDNIALQDEIIVLQKDLNDTADNIDFKLDCMAVFFVRDRADRHREAVIEDIENCVIRLREAQETQEQDSTQTHTETIIIEREVESEPEDAHPGQGRGRNR